MPVPGALPAAPFSREIESLRGRKDPEAIRQAAREMESLFAYEMVKAMRSASGAAAVGQGFGGDVYGSMFDMELARILASRGLGLQEMLLKGLGRSAYSKESAEPGADPSAPPVPAAAGTAFSAPHTHDPVEETRPAVTPSPEDGAAPIREGGRVSSTFGYRKDPLTGDLKFHHGIDIAAPEGTEVFPAKEGVVSFSGPRNGYGNLVEVDHGNGLVTRYAHNRANRVAVGDRVGVDTVIAEVGSTGRSTGPHLHFEVHHEGRKVPPQSVFAGIATGIAKGRGRLSDKYS